MARASLPAAPPPAVRLALKCFRADVTSSGCDGSESGWAWRSLDRLPAANR